MDKTGGAAFPRPGFVNLEAKAGDFDTHPREGMTLRDYFAGQALTGVFHGSDFDYDDEIVARRCYQVADAMIAEREK